MEILRYSQSDYPIVTSWYLSRKTSGSPSLFLPELGLIVPGIAAGFLIQTDANFCILEPFIANPEASKEDRDMALKLILAELVNKARRLKYESVFGFSTAPTMISRAIEQNFQVIEQNSTTVYKEL